MENNFDTAKEHMTHFFATSGHSLDYKSVLLLMTQYAAKFAPAAIETGGKDLIAAIEAKFKAEIAILEQKLTKKEEDHQVSLNELQQQLTAANAVIESKVAGSQSEPTSVEKTTKKASK